jgi:hypothetical protein
VDTIADFLKKIKQPPNPKTLYHYTSQEGLLGIIKDRSIRATDINFLNDSKEFSIGQELIEDVLKKSKFNLGSIQIDESKNSLIDGLLKVLKSEIIKTYVCSFSEKKDELSQWRGYCSNDIGFSLGFNVCKMLECTKSEKGILLQCQYKESNQREIIETVIETWSTYECSKKLLNQETIKSEDKKKCIHLLFLMLFRIAPLLKHESFYEEAEWRLVFIDTKQMKFRPGKSMIIPYINFDLADNPFDSIYHSPTPHRELAKDSLDRLLETNEFNSCITYNSSVPYRNY